jgi:hypothetical protein
MRAAHSTKYGKNRTGEVMKVVSAEPRHRFRGLCLVKVPRVEDP